MKYLALLLLLIGCTGNIVKFEGNCYVPFIYGGEVIKVLRCTNKPLFSMGSDFCVIERKLINRFNKKLASLKVDTLFESSLRNSIQVSCEQYDNVVE